MSLVAGIYQLCTIVSFVVIPKLVKEISQNQLQKPQKWP